MSRMCFSIKIPYWKIIHFEAGQKIGESRLACFKGLAHYDRVGRSLGNSIRNFVGELNHYDSRGHCTGYSRRSGMGRLTHFGNRGEVQGFSTAIMGVLFIHHTANKE